MQRVDPTNESSWKPAWDETFNNEALEPNAVLSRSLAASIYNLCKDITSADALILPGQEGSCLNLKQLDEATLESAARYKAKDGRYTMAYGFDNPCLDGDATNKLRWISLPSLVTTIPQDESFETFVDKWRAIDDLIASTSQKYQGVNSAMGESEDATNPFFTLAAVSGAKWGIASSLAFSVIAVVLFTMDVRLTFVVMVSIAMNVVSVMAIFNMLGWLLGAVEAVTLSILVGTSVDYLVHFVEAFASCHVPVPCELITCDADIDPTDRIR